MKVYEGLFIFSTETAAQQNVAADVSSWIQRFEGVVDQTTEIGTRKLGYKIGKVTEGKALAVQFQMDTSKTAAFRKALELEGSLLSFMITFPPSKKPVPKFLKTEENSYAGSGYGRD